MYDLQEFAKRVRRYRRKAGLSPQELADKAGIAIQSVEHYEAGKNYPNVIILQYLCTALEISSDALTGLGYPKYVINLPADFGVRLYYFRKLKLLSQKKLAELSGVSLSQIKGYENFRSYPNIRMLAKLCNALNVSGGDLLGF